MNKSKVFGAMRASTLAALCAGGLALSAGGCQQTSGEKACSGDKKCSAEKACSGDKKCSAEKKCSGEKQCGQNACGKK